MVRNKLMMTMSNGMAELTDGGESLSRDGAAGFGVESMFPRRRAPEQEVEPGKPTAAILPIYLREMGSTPLIDENQEVSLARELQDAREGMAKLALRLPAQYREYVGGLKGGVVVVRAGLVVFTLEGPMPQAAVLGLSNLVLARVGSH